MTEDARIAGEALSEGDAVGRYVVRARIASGGMGVLYRAFDPELGREIALKLCRVDRGADADRTRAHMLREARGLASVSHPNVVAVHDVGRHQDGLFIAMDLCSGDSLEQWLSTERALRQKLDVFIAIGRGLAAVHAAGLVHGDLKPQNVLVGDGRVRLVDFGLVGPSTGDPVERDGAPAGASEENVETVRLAGPRAVAFGTPGYAAPEQLLEGRSLPASDQFSFCVCLFEALARKRPFQGAEEELAAAMRRGAIWPPISLPARLRAAIDRGLSFAPADRHPSMDALLRELEPSSSRRSIWLAAGAVLVAAAAVAAWAAVPVEDEAARCAEADALAWDGVARERVRRAFEQASPERGPAIYERTAGMLDAYAAELIAARRDACDDTHVRRSQSTELLDRRIACLDERAGRLHVLTEAFSRGGERILERAIEASARLPAIGDCSDAAALLDPVPPPSDAATRATVQRVREDLERVRGLAGAGDLAEAESALAPVVARAEGTEWPPIIAAARIESAVLADARNDYAEAERLLREAVELAARGRDDRTAARAWVLLVWVVGYEQSKPSEGMLLATIAESAVVRAGDRAEQRARLENHIGLVHYAAGELTLARERFERSLAAWDRMEHPDALGRLDALSNLALVCAERGDVREADQRGREAVDGLRALLGPDHPNLTNSLANLGSLYTELGRFAEARAFLEDALRICMDRHGPRHVDTTVVTLHLARLDEREGRLDDAAERVARAKDAVASMNDHPRVQLWARFTEARVALARGDATATELLRGVRDDTAAIVGADHIDTLAVDEALAASLIGRTEALDEAETLVDHALAERSLRLAAEHPAIALDHELLGRIALARGDDAGARRALQESVRLRDAVLDSADPDLSRTRELLARAGSAAATE